ncbi:MAG TPA: hypothetical protein VJQ59_16690 [Candidatus Sulfotelmatobacter sp.]|nr:hypothetical protein [Candidatus Sulfotelmatobacter sp.]
MAAITVNSRQEVVSGSVREVFLNADVADTNTYASGLHLVLSAVSNVPGKITAITASGGTLTFSVTSGPASGALLRIAGL